MDRAAMHRSGLFSSFIAVVVVAFPLAALSAGAPDSVEITVVGPDDRPVEDAVLSLHRTPGANGPGSATAEPAEEGAGIRTGGTESTRAAAGGSPMAVMDQIGLQFAPHVLAVETGTLVDFPNSDQVRHSIYSFSAPRVFELKLYRGSEAPPITFDQSGMVVLGCNIHDDMLAYIYVMDSPHNGVTNEQGLATIEGVEVGAYRIHVRHPRSEESLLVDRVIEVSSARAIRLQLDPAPPPRPSPETEPDPLDGLFGLLER